MFVVNLVWTWNFLYVLLGMFDECDVLAADRC